MIVEIHDDLKPGCLDAVMQTKHLFPARYDNGGAGTHYMLRQAAERPSAPKMCKAIIV